MTRLEGALLARKLFKSQWQEGPYPADGKHFRRNAIGIPAQDLAMARRSGVVSDIARGPCGALGGRRRRAEGSKDGREHREGEGEGERRGRKE